jgi:eukaryotic-like serine/threonine-protein kinase
MPVCAGCQGDVESGASFCPYCGAAILPTPERLGPGATLVVDGYGKAILGHEIGQGGMGIVYRAWLYYDPTGRLAGSEPHPVAVKVLHPLLRGRERARKLFLREAEALRRLAHPNVVHFFALTDDGSELALVMELVQGEPLSNIIARGFAARPSPGAPCLPFVLAWHYFAQLLGALAAIHQLGILHRDVKPANVLVRSDGVVKLTDFGIARIPAEGAAATGGVAPGTGAYMSPEAVQGKELDPRSDLYSAAIVLYEMLVGQSPFDTPDRSEIAVRTAQLEEPPPPISRLLPTAPPVLDVLMAHALAKDPAIRYPSALELGEAFRTALGLPVSEGWAAQKALADLAKTISGIQLPEVPPTVSDAQERAQVLREDLVQAFQQEAGPLPAGGTRR